MATTASSCNLITKPDSHKLATAELPGIGRAVCVEDEREGKGNELDNHLELFNRLTVYVQGLSFSFRVL